MLRVLCYLLRGIKRVGAKGRTRTYDTGINNSITFFVCIADTVFFNTGKISVLPALPTELPWHMQVRFLARLDLLSWCSSVAGLFLQREVSNAINRTSFYRLSVAARKLIVEIPFLKFPSTISVQGLKAFSQPYIYII